MKVLFLLAFLLGAAGTLWASPLALAGIRPSNQTYSFDWTVPVTSLIDLAAESVQQSTDDGILNVAFSSGFKEQNFIVLVFTSKKVTCTFELSYGNGNVLRGGSSSETDTLKLRGSDMYKCPVFVIPSTDKILSSFISPTKRLNFKFQVKFINPESIGDAASTVEQVISTSESPVIIE